MFGSSYPTLNYRVNMYVLYVCFILFLCIDILLGRWLPTNIGFALLTKRQIRENKYSFIHEDNTHLHALADNKILNHLPT